MKEEEKIESDRQRAEVFDALGHPTRIGILKALNEGSLGFADLKKKTDIESSGHLQHHLNKLNGLIKTDEYGRYCLCDQGKDALLTVHTVENEFSTRKTKNPEKSAGDFSAKMCLKLATLLLAALLFASSAIALLEYNQTAALQREISRLKELELEASAYYNEFGAVPITNVNTSFSPPISMYRALQLGLHDGGWNKTSLDGMRVCAFLWQGGTTPDNSTYVIPGLLININNKVAWIKISGTEGAIINNLEYLPPPLIIPPSDYSPIYENDIVCKYVWAIIVDYPTIDENPPPKITLIDAATGEILQHPPF